MNDSSTQIPASCRRCGICCEQGGPALHLEDRALIIEGGLALSNLVRVRTGEPAHDPRQGKSAPTAHEFLKMAGVAGGWCCRFFDRQQMGCSIYSHRPIECRLLFCRATGPLEAIMGRNLLTRHELLDPDDPVLPLLARQEAEISWAEIQDLLAALDRPGAANDALGRLTELVRSDLELRQHFLRLFPARERQELFLLGRPLFLILAPYGLRLRQGRAEVSLYFLPGNRE